MVKQFKLITILLSAIALGACTSQKSGKIISKIFDDNTYTIYVQDDTGAIRSYDVTQDEYKTLDYGDIYGG